MNSKIVENHKFLYQFLKDQQTQEQIQKNQFNTTLDFLKTCKDFYSILNILLY